MKKRLEIPDYMTGKQIAELLHKVKRLKWRRSKLGSDPNFGYCALGQIARLGGVSNETLREVDEREQPEEPSSATITRTYAECSKVFYNNDSSATKTDMVTKLCHLGNEPVPVGKFVKALRARDHMKGRGK